MSYDGGKGGSGVWQWIINQIPPHDTYVEVFLGDGAVMRAKRPARRSFGIEINPVVVQTRWHDHNIPDLIVVCGDAFEVFRRDWPENTFIYLDPPYLMETRSCQRQLYLDEFGDTSQHRQLLRCLQGLRCMVAISGYYSDLYAEELATWRTSTFQTVKRSGESATEWLWMNYPPPLELHDYRYLGKNFRERERIKRKKLRWTERLKRMPDLERYALLEVLGDLRSSASRETAMKAHSARSDDAPGDIAISDDGAPSPLARTDDAAGALATTGDADDWSTIARSGEGHRRASSFAAMPAGIATNSDAPARRNNE